MGKRLEFAIEAHDRATQAIRAVKASLRSLIIEIEAVKAAMRGLGDVAGDLGKVVQSLANMGVASNRFRENTLITLDSLKKSKAVAQDLFDFYDKMSDRSPFKMEEIIDAGKKIEAFGLDSKRWLDLVAESAFGMSKPMGDFVALLERAYAGVFNRRSFATLGITQGQLAAQGVHFDSRGTLTKNARNSGELFDATVKILEDRFGHLKDIWATTFQTLETTAISNLRRIARYLTEGLFGSFKEFLGGVNTALQILLGSEEAWAKFPDKVRQWRPILDALAVPFDMMGRALEYATGKIGPFLDWLAKILDAQKIESFLINLAAILKTIAEHILKFFGVDFSKIFDAKNINAFFDAILKGIQTAVHWFYGIGRVFEELKLILLDWVTEAKDAFTDLAQVFQDRFIVASIAVGAALQRVVGGVLINLGGAMNSVGIAMPFGLGIPLQAGGASLYKSGSKTAAEADEISRSVPVVSAALDAARQLQHDASRNAPGHFTEHNAESFMERMTKAFEGIYHGGDEGRFWRDVAKNVVQLGDTFGGSVARRGMPPAHDFGPDTHPANPTPPLLPGMPAYEAQAYQGFVESKPADYFKELFKIAKEKFELGITTQDELFQTMDQVKDALRRKAEMEDESSEDGMKAWADYYDVVKQSKSELEHAMKDALGYLKSRVSNISEFLDLDSKGNRGKDKQAILPGYLQAQRDILANATLSDTDPLEQQGHIKDLLDVGKEYRDLFDPKKDAFKGRFSDMGGGKNNAMDFVLGGGDQAQALQSLIFNGSPSASRLMNPMERTADNTAAIRDILARGAAPSSVGSSGVDWAAAMEEFVMSILRKAQVGASGRFANQF